jgi:hypothetical protein
MLKQGSKAGSSMSPCHPPMRHNASSMSIVTVSKNIRPHSWASQIKIQQPVSLYLPGNKVSTAKGPFHTLWTNVPWKGIPNVILPDIQLYFVPNL